MSLRISSRAIRRPLAPFVIFFGLLVSGLMAFSQLPINGMPNVLIPVINVSVYLPGAAPTEIESQITNRIESAVGNVGNIKHITSTVTDSVSSTRIEFQLGTDINQALSKVRDQMIEVRPLLPKGSEEPIIQSIDADIVPILTFTVKAPQRSIQESSWFIDNQIVKELLSLKGVAKVQRLGGVGREIRIELDPSKLQAYGITADIINDQLRETVLTLPSGRIENDNEETLIRTVGSPKDARILANTSISLPGGRFAKLGDLGLVIDSDSQQRQIGRLNQEPVVGFAIYRSKSASEVAVEKEVNQTLSKIQYTNPDIDFVEVQSMVGFTKDTYHSALWSFIEGALLAAVVVFVFFRNWRATWITALEIPLSVIPTFLVMKSMGFSLNMVSLLALSLVSGILVDDAIVEIENILRHLKMGKSPYRAAMDAADEIGLAVVATTVVIVAVFVPVSFMGGIVGQYFIQFGLTVAIATVFSLIVARLITPVLAAYFLKPFQNDQLNVAWIDQYSRLLEKALLNRKLTLLIGAIIFVITYFIGINLPTDFMPFEDKSESSLQVELPAGSKLEDTDRTLSMVTDKLLKRPEVKSVFTLAGSPDSDTNIDGEARKATVIIKLKPRNERSIDVKTFEHDLLKDFEDIPNARIAVLNENGSKALTLSLSSEDPVLLEKTASSLLVELRNLPELKEVSSTIPLPHTEYVITPRTEDASRLGVTTDSISETIRIATMGDLNSSLARINIAGRQIPVRVLIDPNSKRDESIFSQLLVPNADGKMIPLNAIADINLNAGPSSVERYDRERQITMEANLNGVTLGEALDAIDKLDGIKKLPHGVRRYDTGDAELLKEMFDSFSMAIVAGALIVLGVLILLFRTVLQPLTIMIALPLSIFGAFLALMIAHASLSLPAVIGVLMLTGIVGKNGILLVDCIIDNVKKGESRHLAIVDACRQRARPIVMTSVAMIAGMIPLTLGLGAGTAFRQPMAIAVIGGLVTSTALSLLFVPVIYTFVDDVESWLTPKLKSFMTVEATS